MPIERVLVVEDEPLLMSVVCMELEDAGLTVHQATTADEALKVLVAGTDIDLLFTDIRMPGSMNGWGLAELARAQWPDLKAFYASGYSDVEHRPVPVSQFLPKPYPMLRSCERYGAWAARAPTLHRGCEALLLDPLMDWQGSS